MTDWPQAAVYDVTLAYPGTFPQNETDLLSGVLPESVRFHVRRYSVASDIPVESAELERWLRSRWDEKDDRISRFVSAGGEFSGEDLTSASRPQPGLSDWIHVYYGLSVAFWLAFDFFVIVVLLSCTPVCWLFIAVGAFFIFMGSKYGGFELFQAQYTSSRVLKTE